VVAFDGAPALRCHALLHQLQACQRLRPAVDHIARDNNMVRLPSIDMRHHRFKRGQVSMRVGECGNFQGPRHSTIPRVKILLLGGNSQLGTDLLPALHNHDVVATSRAPAPSSGHRALDVTDLAATRTLIAGLRPDAIINTTAFHRVDDIENDASEALRMNAHVPHQLALLCRDAGAVLMHVSTDYVFDGAKRAPYTEQDPVNPLSAYGSSKVAGEMLVRATRCKHLIVRSCGLYGLAGSSGKGTNFVNTMLRLAAAGKPIKVVADQTCTPTFTRDLARQMVLLLEASVLQNKWGTFHATNTGHCTWFEFAGEIFRLAGRTPDLAPTTSAAYNAPATRPPYSVLHNSGLAVLGLPEMRPWKAALAEYVALQRAAG
jgi:dTDP-4-dehydrorhamnose reductase